MMRDSSQRGRSLTLFIVVLASLGMTYYHLGIFIPHAIARHAAQGVGGGYSFGGDFYPIWLTSRQALLHHRNPYDADMTRAIQTGLFGHPLEAHNAADPAAHYREFAYPAYVDLLFWPLALLSFPAVRLALAVALVALTSLSISLWIGALRLATSPQFFAIALMLTLSSYAVLEGLVAAQPGLIAGFLLAASFAALVRHRLFLAGSLFACTSIKPQMSVVVAAYLLLWAVSRWRTRRAFLFGLMGWFAAFVIGSLIVWPHWIADWLRVLSGYGRYSPPPLITYSLGAKLGPHLGPPLIFILLAAALLLAWRMRSLEAGSPAFSVTISLLLALTSITLLPGQAVYDHVILLPGIVWTARRGRESLTASRTFRVVLSTAMLVLFWQWIVVLPLLAALPFLSDQMFFGRGLWLLPFHAAASVPLAVCVVLGYLLLDSLRHKRWERQATFIPAQRA
jgi:hypothetical protein